MAKRTPKISSIPLNLPGIIASDLLELIEILPGIPLYLSIIAYATTLIAQIRVSVSTASASDVQGLESVNTYNKLILAKSTPLLYITGAIAIRKTISAHANDPDDNGIISAHTDLISNLTGISSTKGGIKAALTSPSRLRAYRRGIMLQTAGTLQATPIHSPNKIRASIDTITPNEFLSLLQFPTENITLDQITSWINSTISPNNLRQFVDILPVPSKVNLEVPLIIERSTPDLPELDESSIGDQTNLPEWRRLAIKQLQNLSSD